MIGRRFTCAALLALGLGALARPSDAAPPRRTEVLIIGAGLGGLATAYELKKAAVRYHVVELGARVGGRVRTVRYQRGTERPYADAGMEEYWESNPAVKLFRALGLRTRSDVALSSMVIGGKLEPLGDETRPVFLRRVLGADGLDRWQALQRSVAPIVRETASRAVTPATLALKDASFSDWIAAQKLPPRLADWIRISVECEAGTTWDQISALDGIAELHIFLGEGEKSLRVLGGNERFTDALARAVGLRHISLNQRVTRVVTRGDRAVVHVLDARTNESRVIEADHVVSTVPLFRLFEIQFDPPLSAAKRQAITTQGWGAYFKAHVFVPREAWGMFEKDGTSLLPILSDSPLGVLYDGNPEQRTRVRILSLLVTGPSAETFNMLPLDEARGQIREHLGRLFPGIAEKIEGIEFYRYHPRAVAAWPPGRSRFDELADEVRRPEHRVYLGGDFTEGSHSDGAFVAAQRVARQIHEARAGSSAGRASAPWSAPGARERRP